MLEPLVLANLELEVASNDILAVLAVTALFQATALWKSLIVAAVCVPVCEDLALRLASVSLAVAKVAIPLSFVLSVAVSILFTIHSFILVISKASHSISSGSYIEANISQLPNQSAPLEVIKFQYVQLVGIFPVVSAIQT